MPARTNTNRTSERIAAIDWTSRLEHLAEYGWATLNGVLDRDECRQITKWYDDEVRFRSHIVMARHGFGQGEYKYFNAPLPQLITALRTLLYERLAPPANAWNEAMGLSVRYPNAHAEFVERCHAAGQTRPTPLLLRYGAGDYNCLHQDLYGEHVFPLQAVVLLSRPGTEFDGGELVLTEQRPRMQSRACVLPLAQGD